MFFYTVWSYMKAMILAAGKGTRMLPLTAITPKPLLTVGGKSLLAHHLQNLAKAGITEIVINTFHLGSQIVAAIANGASYGVNVHYSVEEEILETGGGIVKALDFLGADPFLVISADIFTDFPLHSLPHTPTGLAHLVMVENPSYKVTGDFGLEKGYITANAAQTYTYGNIGIFRPEFFSNAPQGAFPLGGLLRQHVAAGLITGQFFAGLWHNIGTPADLELANLAVHELTQRGDV
jgi:MurNAc alpha-1-phosphate uridylyltransferase